MKDKTDDELDWLWFTGTVNICDAHTNFLTFFRKINVFENHRRTTGEHIRDNSV